MQQNINKKLSKSNDLIVICKLEKLQLKWWSITKTELCVLSEFLLLLIIISWCTTIFISLCKKIKGWGEGSSLMEKVKLLQRFGWGSKDWLIMVGVGWGNRVMWSAWHKAGTNGISPCKQENGGRKLQYMC